MAYCYWVPQKFLFTTHLSHLQISPISVEVTCTVFRFLPQSAALSSPRKTVQCVAAATAVQSCASLVQSGIICLRKVRAVDFTEFWGKNLGND